MQKIFRFLETQLIKEVKADVSDVIFQKRLALQTYSKNGQVNQQASVDRPVSSLLGLVRALQLVVDPS